jgi:hypothetical protein
VDEQIGAVQVLLEDLSGKEPRGRSNQPRRP